VFALSERADVDRVVIFDTTLRDGEQSPGASLNIEEKEQVAKKLARLNVDVIEAGFPISSQEDFDSVKLIAETIEGPIIAGLARAVPKDIERAGESLKEAPRRRIHTFIATSEIHMKYKLKRSREQVLQSAVDAVKLAKTFTDDVEFSPEDATRTEPDFLCEVVEAVIAAGATTVNIPDTVGYTMPSEFTRTIRLLKEKVPNIEQATISVHCHNDLGLAVANSLAAVQAGARQVECTINGIGERAGNAALEEIVMAMNTRKDLMGVWHAINTKHLYETSRLVSNLTGFVVQPNKAIVGRNAFAHEAGIHQHGVIEEKSTYEIMNAEDIGRTAGELVLGRHSGHHAFEKRVRELGYTLSAEDMQKALERFKTVANKKKEISDRDIESIIADEVYVVPETYHLEYMHVVAGGTTTPTATIGIRKVQNGNGETIKQAHLGVGSVDAVYRAIDSICQVPHTLLDYNVKSVTGGTDALGEVTVRIQSDQDKVFIGRGASTDIIEASAKAYIQAINKLVYHTSAGS
jgi:2-isopropylmalate synthase